MKKKQEAEFKKVETAKALKSIKSIGIPLEDYLNIKRAIIQPSQNEEEIERTIQGISQEDEFAFICRLMKTTTHLIPLEQRPAISGDYICPDFLARFQPSCLLYECTQDDSLGFNCFVEVKTTSDPKIKYKIGGSRLKRLRNFADAFGVPLIFAVRFLRFNQNALWIIVEDSDRSSTSLTVAIDNLCNGIRHILWDDYWYMLLPNIQIISIYDTNYTELCAQHPEYGTHKELQIITHEKAFCFEGPIASGYLAFLKAFHLQPVDIQRHGSITRQTSIPELLVCSMVDMAYTFNQLPCDEKGQPLTEPSTVMNEFEPKVFDIHFINRLANALANLNLLFLLTFEEPEKHFEKWKQYGGNKSKSQQG